MQDTSPSVAKGRPSSTQPPPAETAVVAEDNAYATTKLLPSQPETGFKVCTRSPPTVIRHSRGTNSYLLCFSTAVSRLYLGKVVLVVASYRAGPSGGLRWPLCHRRDGRPERPSGPERRPSSGAEGPKDGNSGGAALLGVARRCGPLASRPGVAGVASRTEVGPRGPPPSRAGRDYRN